MTLEAGMETGITLLRNPPIPSFLSSLYPPAILHFQTYSFWWPLSLCHKLRQKSKFCQLLKVVHLVYCRSPLLLYDMNQYDKLIMKKRRIELSFSSHGFPQEILMFCFFCFVLFLTKEISFYKYNKVCG